MPTNVILRDTLQIPPIRVLAVAAYVRDPRARVGGGCDDAYKFTRAVLAEPFETKAAVPVRGVWRVLRPAKPERATEWFAQIAADRVIEMLDGAGAPRAQFVVPLPCIRNDPPRELAQALANELGAEVCDVLRRDRPPTDPAAERAKTILELLRIEGEVPTGPCVLVDDVMIEGELVRACTACLEAAGATVSMAVFAARTMTEAPRSAFDFRTAPLPRFVPRHPLLGI